MLKPGALRRLAALAISDALVSDAFLKLGFKNAEEGYPPVAVLNIYEVYLA